MIGIVVNPYSGKDIRRIVSGALAMDNNNKMNTVERIVGAVRNFSDCDIVLMPDGYNLSHRIAQRLGDRHVFVYDMDILDRAGDSSEFAKRMERDGCECLIVLGGDGTNRVVAKELDRVPLLPISTGTNNVFPTQCEGTAAGLVAAALCCGFVTPEGVCFRTKRIEISVNGEFRDIALVDVAVSGQTQIGSRAIWKLDQVEGIIACQANPARTGFSALAGSVELIDCREDRGIMLYLGEGETKYIGPLTAGMLDWFSVAERRDMPLGRPVRFMQKAGGVLALDGEREVLFSQGDVLEFTVTRNGPLKVDIEEAVNAAKKANMFLRKTNDKGAR